MRHANPPTKIGTKVRLKKECTEEWYAAYTQGFSKKKLARIWNNIHTEVMEVVGTAYCGFLGKRGNGEVYNFMPSSGFEIVE